MLIHCCVTIESRFAVTLLHCPLELVLVVLCLFWNFDSFLIIQYRNFANVLVTLVVFLRVYDSFLVKGIYCLLLRFWIFLPSPLWWVDLYVRGKAWGILVVLDVPSPYFEFFTGVPSFEALFYSFCKQWSVKTFCDLVCGFFSAVVFLMCVV